NEPPTAEQEAAAQYVYRSATLFAPLGSGTKVANSILGLPLEHRWLLCLDELEDLKMRQMAALATCLRGTASGLALKITTLPYTIEEHTETMFSTASSAVDHRDYSLHRLQFDPGKVAYRRFVGEILKKFVGASAEDGEQVGRTIFGNSRFSERAESVDRTFAKRREDV